MSESLAKFTDASSHEWTTESLRDYVLGLIVAHDKLYTERHAALKDFISARHADYLRSIDVAFAAQQSSLTVALSAQEKAVAAALSAQEKAVSAAMAAADRAVLKAEAASERRFEGVNEFRATLADQQRTLMPRSEVDVLIKGLSEKISANHEATRLLAEQANSTLIRREAQAKGLSSGWSWAVAVLGVVALVIGLLARFAK